MRRAIIMASITVACLGGCSTAPQSAPSDPIPSKAYPQNVVLNGLENGLVVSNHPVVEPGDGESRPLKVQQPVRNVTDKVMFVQYQFQFYDRNGKRLSSDEPFVFKELAPKVEERVEGVALDPAATEWRLVMRSAQTR
jgi:uncharacterized protein YcfL